MEKKKQIKFKAALIVLFIYTILVFFVTEGDFDSMYTRFFSAFIGCIIVGLTLLIENGAFDI